MERRPIYKKSIIGLIYFLVFFVILSFLYFRNFKGIQGDAYYYYSYAVSIIWDKDLDLKNQFDHPVPGVPNQTVTSGNYFIDAKTGRAFSFFNIGTGLLMTPSLAAIRLIDLMKGRSEEDPFSFRYQKIVCFTNIILTSLAILVLFIMLKEHFSLGVAIICPPLFLFGTNWLFYSVFFSGWSHAYSLAICILGLWAFLKGYHKKSVFASALFGFLFGLLFCIRNFNLTIFGFLLIFSFLADYTKNEKRDQKLFIASLNNGLGQKRRANEIFKRSSSFKKINFSKFLFSNRQQLRLNLVALIFFLISASPQFLYYHLTHGSPIVSSYTAAAKAIKPFFAPMAEPFRVIYLKNLSLLSTTLFNSENGLFYYHPLYLLGLLGFILFKPKNHALKITAWALFFSVYLYWFFDAAYYDTWFCRAAGAGFGHRRFLDLLLFFILGAAFFIEKISKNILSRFFLSGVISFLLNASVSFFNIFIYRYADFFREKDELIKFYFFLFKGWWPKLFFLITWGLVFILLGLKDKNRNEEVEKKEFKFQPPIVLIIIFSLLLIPPLIFRGDPEWDRQRFRERQGFFLLYSSTPLVKIYGKEWLLPENMGRKLLCKEAKIILPSPARKGDALLFKITGSARVKTEIATMEVWTSKTLQGIQKIKAGKGVYLIPIKEDKSESREIRLRMNYHGDVSDFIFHEGKIIFREQSSAPFGHIDLPKEDKILATKEVWLEGWVLDDWGVERIEIRGKNLPEYIDRVDLATLETCEEIILGEAEFLWERRPDVERIYVLYPDILKAGWKIKIDCEKLPFEVRHLPFLIRVIAWDKERNSSELGRKLIIWRN